MNGADDTRRPVKTRTQNEPDSGKSTVRLRKFGPIHAPELSGGKGWLNTDQPITLHGLKGKVVLLDFWTYCCINCMHILPDLKRLETQYPNELAVIGVHSAKFDNEKDSENIRQAILRYEIHHPVVNDADFIIWRSYGVRAWPSLVLIDPEGYVANAYSGEGHYDEINQDIKTLIEEAKAKGNLKSEPLKLTLEHAKLVDMPLSFPGKILGDESGQRIFVSDSNHNRIVISKPDGSVTDVIGSGHMGKTDGEFSKALFHHPQGMALDGKFLYVADTENHLLRRINLKTKIVETVAGTGDQGYVREISGEGKKVSLSTPWDLQIIGRNLYIAMAGLHQIWKFDLDKGTVGNYAGSGAENCFDGTLETAAFAQPSGLATDGQHLFVADSEVSSIRSIDVNGGGKVSTVAGSGDLFGFGDKDGIGENARFQHPLGVAFHHGRLYVADTYNHKIRLINLAEGSAKTLAGSGNSGHEDGEKATFFEPGGLSFSSEKLYVADTDNHAIRVVDVKTGQVSTLALTGLQPVTMPPNSADEVVPNAESLVLPVQKVQANSVGELVLDVRLPPGFHLNDKVMQRYWVKIENGDGVTFKADQTKGAAKDLKLPVSIPFATQSKGTAQIEVGCTFYFCRTDNTGVCRIKSVIWKIPVEIQAAGNLKIKAEFRVKTTDP